MLIHELSREASLDVLARTHLGRLACCERMQPYLVPFHFGYHDNCLYSFSMPGQKIEWMRANPLVCVEADHMRRERWTTVVVFGRYVELPDTPEMRSERAFALGLLQRKPVWWEPGSVKIAHQGTPAPLVPIFYRISIVQITGRSATAESSAPDPGQPEAPAVKKSWLRNVLQRAPSVL